MREKGVREGKGVRRVGWVGEDGMERRGKKGEGEGGGGVEMGEKVGREGEEAKDGWGGGETV